MILRWVPWWLVNGTTSGDLFLLGGWVGVYLDVYLLWGLLGGCRGRLWGLLLWGLLHILGLWCACCGCSNVGKFWLYSGRFHGWSRPSPCNNLRRIDHNLRLSTHRLWLRDNRIHLLWHNLRLRDLSPSDNRYRLYSWCFCCWGWWLLRLGLLCCQLSGG